MPSKPVDTCNEWYDLGLQLGYQHTIGDEQQKYWIGLKNFMDKNAPGTYCGPNVSTFSFLPEQTAGELNQVLAIDLMTIFDHPDLLTLIPQKTKEEWFMSFIEFLSRDSEAVDRNALCLGYIESVHDSWIVNEEHIEACWPACGDVSPKYEAIAHRYHQYRLKYEKDYLPF